MILPDELKKIIEHNTVASVNLNQTSLDVIPGHDVKVVDVTKLLIDLQRTFILFTSTAIGSNKIVVAGDQTPPDKIREIRTENMLRNKIRNNIKEMTNARTRME